MLSVPGRSVCTCVIACMYVCQFVCVNVWVMLDRKGPETAAVAGNTLPPNPT